MWTFLYICNLSKQKRNKTKTNQGKSIAGTGNNSLQGVTQESMYLELLDSQYIICGMHQLGELNRIR